MNTRAALTLTAVLALYAGCGEAVVDDYCSSDCAGCCDYLGSCHPGTTPGACGSTGAVCMTCAVGETCEAGRCVSTCDSTTCPAGCCRGNQCVSGTADDECGTGGLACLSCAAGESCSNQSCVVQSCDPSSCGGGCCDGTSCRPGTTEELCGSGGASCAQCADNEVCVDGACEPSPCGPDTCAGCCAAGECKTGTTAKNCGGSGAACVKCLPGFACDAGKCEFSLNALWEVTVVSAAIRSPQNGGPVWDPDKIGYGLEAPDVYVKVSSGGQSEKTDRQDDTYTPQLNEQVITVKAWDLGQTVNVAVMDYDLIGTDQTIGSCNIAFPAEALLKGHLITLNCGGPDVVNVRFSFKLK